MQPHASPQIITNRWYVLCSGDELTERPLGRVVGSQPLVVYRTADGTPNVMFDLCPHRRAPLSMGRVEGDALRCAYHGMLFDRSGKCVEIPSQDVIPPRARVETFPVVERYGFVWVWIGDAERVDESLLPVMPWRDDESWDRTVVQYFHVDASHKLMNDNLLDLSHVAFLHSGSIGFDPSNLGADPLTVDVQEEAIRCQRYLPDVEQAPAHRAWSPMPGRVNRTQVKEWFAPSVISVLSRNEDENTCIELRADHFLTPESETTHHYYIAVSRNFRVGEEEFSRQLDADTRVVHGEDVEMVEAQQRMVQWTPGRRDMGLKADVAVLAAQKILARLASAGEPMALSRQ